MAKSEYERNLGEPREAASFLSNVTKDARHRLSSRIFIEDQHIKLDSLPLGGEEGLDPILSFLPLAREGFALNLRSERLQKNQIEDILNYTKPSNTVSKELESLGIALRPYVLTEETRLSLYRHTEATLIFLSTLGKFEEESKISYWPYRPTIENIWELCGEMEEVTRQMLLEPTPVTERQSAIRATHFFAAGHQIAQALL